MALQKHLVAEIRQQETFQQFVHAAPTAAVSKLNVVGVIQWRRTLQLKVFFLSHGRLPP